MDLREKLLLLHDENCIDAEELIMIFEFGIPKRIPLDHKRYARFNIENFNSEIFDSSEKTYVILLKF